MKMPDRLCGALRLMLVAVVIVSLASCHSSRRAAGSGPKHLSRSEIANAHPATARLLAEADSWIGTPYRYAGTDRKGVDCSALMRNVFRDALAISLPRNSAAQADWCTPIRRSELMAGDLVFFSGSSSGNKIGHVGIYVGDNRIIHASPSQGVTMASLNTKWFEQRYRRAGRVEQYYAMVKKQPGKKSGKKRSGKKKGGELPQPPADPMAGPPAPQLASRETHGTPSISLDQYVAAVEKSLQQSQTEPETAAPDTTVVQPAVIPDKIADPEVPAPVINVASSPVKAAGAPTSVRDARARVVNAFKELPPDSVLTDYFD